MIMKIIFFYLLALLAALSFAQDPVNLTGRIAATDNSGLAGCVIELLNLLKASFWN